MQGPVSAVPRRVNRANKENNNEIEEGSGLVLSVMIRVGQRGG
jgi:hypothetical protein